MIVVEDYFGSSSVLFIHNKVKVLIFTYLNQSLNGLEDIQDKYPWV